jgi:hypothetical protein
MESSHSLLYSPLYAHSNIRRLHLKLDSLSRSVGTGSALRVLPEIQLVPVRVFPTFFLHPRRCVHSEKYIRRAKGTKSRWSERKKKEKRGEGEEDTSRRPAVRGARSFLSGRRRVAQEIR